MGNSHMIAMSCEDLNDNNMKQVKMMTQVHLQHIQNYLQSKIALLKHRYKMHSTACNLSKTVLTIFLPSPYFRSDVQ